MSNEQYTITATTVTAGDLAIAQVAQYPGVPAGVTPEDLVPVGADEILWVKCPADYDPEEITAEDILHDPAITVVPAGSRSLFDADTNERIGVATLEQAEASDEAAERGELGLILIDADGEVVHPGEEDEPWTAHPVRRVYVEGELPS